MKIKNFSTDSLQNRVKEFSKDDSKPVSEIKSIKDIKLPLREFKFKSGEELYQYIENKFKDKKL